MPLIPPSPSIPTVFSKLTYLPHHALSLLQSCRSPRDLSQLHSQLLRRGQSSDPFIATKMLESCIATGASTTTAIHIFNTTSQPNLFMYTTMIRAFVAANNPHQAIHFYTLMCSLNIQPYKFTFLYALKAFSMTGAAHRGRPIHATILKVGLNCDIYLRSTLVSFYSSCGYIGDALRVFEEFPDKNNMVIWNAMIAASFANGDSDNGRRLFDEMPHRDVRSWNLSITGFSKCGRVSEARALFDGMPERDLLSWSAMVGGYVSSGMAVEALRVFDDMVCAGVRPDGVMLSMVLTACAQSGALDTGKWVHAYIEKCRLALDVVLGTSLVDMYAKCGCVDLAIQVFAGMEYKNVSSWNAMICGLAMNGRGNEALSLFGEMERVGLVPNDVTFVGVLSACGHVGKVGEGCKHFERMSEDFKIDPKVEHYGCMVDLFARAGLVSEASKLIASMPMELNPVVLGSFLSACGKHGDVDAGEDVIKDFSRSKPGDGGCHVLISNIYASKNQWDGVARTRRVLNGTGFQKIPGCSSIEVNNLVHEFVVRDQTHPCWEEIYTMIDKLSTHLQMEGFIHPLIPERRIFDW